MFDLSSIFTKQTAAAVGEHLIKRFADKIFDEGGLFENKARDATDGKGKDKDASEPEEMSIFDNKQVFEDEAKQLIDSLTQSVFGTSLFEASQIAKPRQLFTWLDTE